MRCKRFIFTERRARSPHPQVLTRNYENMKKVNFNGIKHLLDTGETLTTRNLDFIKRDGSIFTKTTNKIAQFKFDKRIKENDEYKTYPFGFNGGSL